MAAIKNVNGSFRCHFTALIATKNDFLLVRLSENC